jgi:hypothetical protein
MDEPVLKAFVLCDEITKSPGDSKQVDVRGAGLNAFVTSEPFPIKRSFWAYVEIGDQKPVGTIQLGLMRADSGRRFLFRKIPVDFPSRLQPTMLVTKVFECVFPEPGVYFVELWYDARWLIDQRIEVV